jgi:hypothetical protein
MRTYSRLVAILGCAASIALISCSTNASMTPASGSAVLSQALTSAPTGPGWIRAGKLVYHVPRYMPTRSSSPGVFIPNFLLTYHGGPVLTEPKAYIILWGYKKYGDPDKVAKLLKSYCKVQGGSGHTNIYTQYYETISGVSTYISNPKDQCGGIWDDETDAVAQYPTDAQVAAEALAGVQTFGYDPNGSYVVATPNGRSTQGFGTQWCGYHSAAYNGQLVAYTNLSYMPNAGSACGANAIPPPKDESGADEGVTIVEGSQYGASITDPEPGASWYSYEYGEIDLCGWQDLQNDKFGKKSYTTAAMFSNATESCVQTY